MVDCDFCDVENSGVLVFEDDLVSAFIPFDCVARGQIVVFSKEHLPIVEDTPVEVLSRLFEVSSKLSSIVFDSLKVAGTNIVVQNGLPSGQSVPHVSFNVVPRSEGDGLGFDWSPLSVSPGDLESVKQLLLQPTVLSGGSSGSVGSGFVDSGADKEVVSGDDNYLIKHFKNRKA